MTASSFSILFLKPSSFNLNPQSPIFSLATQTRTRTLTFCTTPSHEIDARDSQLDAPSPSNKNAFAVSLGMFFIKLTSRFIKPPKSVAKVAAGFFWRREDSSVTIVDDPVDNGVIIWESVKSAVAEREDRATSTLGFSFSAAGLLFPYHLGVANFLIEKGYIKDSTPLAGSSAGAIVCVVIASGSSMQEALIATKCLAEDCRLKGTAFRLEAVLRDVLVRFLPDDVHMRSNGRVRVAVTQVLWRPKGILVDEFDSKEDLINAVITSSFIPGYLAPRPATMFRNRLCIDGGLTQFMPPTDAEETVRVCPFPSSQLGFQGIEISPDRNPINRASTRELLNWALGPAAADVLDRLFELGYLDAAVWADENPIQDFVKADGSTECVS